MQEALVSHVGLLGSKIWQICQGRLLASDCCLKNCCGHEVWHEPVYALQQLRLSARTGFQSAVPKQAGAQLRRWAIGDFAAAYAAGAVTPSQVWPMPFTLLCNLKWASGKGGRRIKNKICNVRACIALCRHIPGRRFDAVVPHHMLGFSYGPSACPLSKPCMRRWQRMCCAHWRHPSGEMHRCAS